jgi:hypothetical protein
VGVQGLHVRSNASDEAAATNGHKNCIQLGRVSYLHNHNKQR